METNEYDIWMAAIQDGYIGNIVDIANRAGGAKNIYNMKKEQLIRELGITERLANHIEKCQNEIDIVKLVEYMNDNNINFAGHNNTNYPRRLCNIYSKPYGLFYKGKLPDDNVKSVAIIGSRECSEYGRLMAEYFGDRLAREGINIVSGMAWGIDGIAQMSAVLAGGHSYAVFGCGVDVVYPAKNHKLYDKLLQNGNGVISEYAPKTNAAARQFPPRNRIISALCDVLIVVEARAKSGTLITVDMAIEQGKSVMVIPGRITDPLSVGCLNLITEGAKIITGVDSVLEELRELREVEPARTVVSDNTKKHGRKNHPKPIALVKTKVDKKYKSVYDLLTINPLYVEYIAEKSGKSLNETLVMLTEMETLGLVKETSIGYFARCEKLS